MKISWPSAINPSIASTRRHVVGVHPHLIPSQDRGLVISTTATRRFEDESLRRVTAWARGQYLITRTDFSILVSDEARWDDDVRFSPAMLEHTHRVTTGAGRGLYTIDVDAKDDPDLLQVVTITRRDGSLVSKFADEGLVLRHDRTCPVPFDPTPDAGYLTCEPPTSNDHRDAKRLTDMAYPSATYYRPAETDAPARFIARWWRGDFAVTAMTARTP